MSLFFLHETFFPAVSHLIPEPLPKRCPAKDLPDLTLEFCSGSVGDEAGCAVMKSDNKEKCWERGLTPGCFLPLLVLGVPAARPRPGAAQGSAGGRCQGAGCGIWERIPHGVLCQDGELTAPLLPAWKAHGRHQAFDGMFFPDWPDGKSCGCGAHQGAGARIHPERSGGRSDAAQLRPCEARG